MTEARTLARGICSQTSSLPSRQRGVLLHSPECRNLQVHEAEIES